MTTIDSTRRSPRTVSELTYQLVAAGRGAEWTFSAAELWSLPEPARRWLSRAIAPGTSLARRAELRMHGEIKLGRRWHDFTAEQTLVPEHGFVWAARTHLAGVPVNGFDSFVDGVGTMRWRVLGVPIVREGGPSVTRSAFGRLAAELVLLPTSLVDATWRSSVVTDAATYVHSIVGRPEHARVTIDVAADGRLTGVRLHRWGDPVGQGYQLQPFKVSSAGEYDAGSLRIPDGIVASWPTAGGEFFRASLDAVTVS